MSDLLYNALITHDLAKIQQVQESLRESDTLQPNVDYALRRLTSYTYGKMCNYAPEPTKPKIVHGRMAKYAVEMTTKPETLNEISLDSEAMVLGILRSGVRFDSLPMIPQLPKIKRELIKRLVYAGAKFQGFSLPAGFNVNDFALYPEQQRRQIYTLMVIWRQIKFFLPNELVFIIFNSLV